MKRCIVRLLVVGLVLGFVSLLVLVGAGLVVRSKLDDGSLARRLGAELSSGGATVEVGRIVLPARNRFRLEDVRLAFARGGAGRIDAIDLRWAADWKGRPRLRVEELVVDAPSFDLRALGATSVSTAASPPAPAPGVDGATRITRSIPEAGSELSSLLPPWLVLESVRIGKGRVAFDDAPELVELDGTLNMQEGGDFVLESGGRTSTGGKLALSAKGRVDARRLDLASLRVDLNGTALLAEGDWPLKKGEKSAGLRLRADDVDPLCLIPLLPDAARREALGFRPFGRAKIAATIAPDGGSASLVPVGLGMILPDMGERGLELKVGAGALHLRWGPERELRLEAVQLDLDGMPLALTATLNQAPDGAKRVTASLVGSELSVPGLLGLLPREQRRAIEEYEAEGRLDVRIGADGPLENPAVDGSVDLKGVALGARLYPKVGKLVIESGKLHFREGNLFLQDVKGALAGAALELKGAVVAVADAKRRNVKLDLACRDLDLARLARLVPARYHAPLYEPQGKTNLDVDLRMPPLGPVAVDLRLPVEKLGARVPLGEDKWLPVVFEGGSLRYRDGDLVLRKARVKLGEIVLEGNGRLEKAASADRILAVDLRCDDLKLGLVEALLPPGAESSWRMAGLTGSLDLDMVVEGRPDRPRLKGSLKPRELAVAPPRLALPRPVTFPRGRIRFEGDEIHLEDLEARSGPLSIVTSATVTRVFEEDRAIDLDARLPALDAGELLSALGPTLTAGFPAWKLAGKVAAKLRVKGPLSAPRPSLGVAAKDLEISLPPWGEDPLPRLVLSDGRVRYDDGTLSVEEFSAELAGRKLQVSGTVEDLRGSPTWKLAAKAPRLDVGALWNFAPESIRAKLSGARPDGALDVELRLEGQGAVPRPNGRVRLVGLRILPPRPADGAVPAAPGSLAALGLLEGISTLRLSDGSLHVENGRLRLEDLALLAGKSRIDLRGGVDRVLESTRRLDLSVDAPKLACVDLVTLLPSSLRDTVTAWNPEGELAFSASATGSGSAPVGEARLGLGALSLRAPTPLVKDPLRFGSGEIRLRTGRVEVSKLVCAVGTAKLELNGSLEGLSSSGLVDGSARSDAFPLATLVALLPEDARKQCIELGVGGELPFRIQVRGRLPRPDVQAHLDLHRIHLAPPALASKARLSFSTGSIDATTACIELEPTVLRLGAASIQAQGKLEAPLSPERRIDVKLRAAKLDLAELTRLLPAALREKTIPYELGGTTGFEVSLAGSAAAYRLDGNLELEGIRGRVPKVGGKGLPLRFASGSIRAFDEKLGLRNVTLLAGPIPVALTGELSDPFGKGEIRFRARCTELELATLEKTLPEDLRKTLAPLALKGRLDVNLLLTGDRRKIDVQGSTELAAAEARIPLPGGDPLKLSLPALELDLSPEKIALRKATSLKLGPMTLHLRKLACLDYTGTMGIEAEIEGEALDLARISGFLPPAVAETWKTLAPEGRVGARIDARGTVSEPELAGEVALEECRLTLPVGEKGLPMAFGPGKVTLRPKALDLAELPLRSRGMKGRLDLRLDDPTGAAQVTAKLTVDEILPDALRPFLSDEAKAALEKADPKGHLEGFLKASAPLSEITSETAYGQLRPVKLSAALPIDTATERLVLDAGTVTASVKKIRVEGLTLRLGSETLRLDGTVDEPLGGGRLDLKTDAKSIDLAAMGKALFGPDGPVKLGGATRLSVHVTGRTTDPRWTGRIDLPGVTIRPRDMEAVLKGDGGHLAFDEKDFEVKDVAFQVGRSRMVLRGKVLDYRGSAVFAPGSALTATLQGGDLAPLLRLPAGYAFIGLADVKAELAGALASPVFGGEMTLPKGLDFIVGQGKDVFKMRVDEFASKVDYRDGRVRVNEFAGKAYQGTLSAEASFVLTGAEPEFRGQLQLRRMNLNRFFTVGTNFDGCFHGEVESDFRFAGKGTTPQGVGGDGRFLVRGLRVEGARTMDKVGWEKFMTPSGKKLGVLGAAALLFGASRSSKIRALLDGASTAMRILRNRHEIGTVEATLALGQGVLRADPIRCVEDPERLRGHLALKLENTALEGRLGGYVEGEGVRVSLANILFSGPAASPTIRPEHANDLERLFREDIRLEKAGGPAPAAPRPDAPPPPMDPREPPPPMDPHGPPPPMDPHGPTPDPDESRAPVDPDPSPPGGPNSFMDGDVLISPPPADADAEAPPPPPPPGPESAPPPTWEEPPPPPPPAP